MAKRFSGDVSLTISFDRHSVLPDSYSIRVKAPGCKECTGSGALETGYRGFHGDEESFDQAARQQLSFMEENKQDKVYTSILKQAAKDKGKFHVGRGKADRWPGGKTNVTTKSERRR